MDEEAKKVMVRLQRLCSKAEYCREDIFRKALKTLDAERAGEVTGQLVRDGFVDDARYASAFAREKSSLTGWGPVKIRFALAARHIPPEDIAAALSECDSARADSRLAGLIAAKGRSLKGDPEIKLKLIRYALGRGYEYEDVEAAVNSWLSSCI